MNHNGTKRENGTVLCTNVSGGCDGHNFREMGKGEKLLCNHNVGGTCHNEKVAIYLGFGVDRPPIAEAKERLLGKGQNMTALQIATLPVGTKFIHSLQGVFYMPTIREEKGNIYVAGHGVWSFEGFVLPSLPDTLFSFFGEEN